MHTLAITEQGARVQVQGESLLIQRDGQLLRRVRLGELHQLLLFGGVELSAAALAALARRGVDVVFLTLQGYFRARLVGRPSTQAQLRLEQLRRALDEEFCVRVSRSLIQGKVLHQRQLLLRAQRRLRDDTLAEVLGRLRLLAEDCPRQTDADRLRGLEGMAAALYFGQFGKLLRVPDFTFTGRSRRPPRDEVNACLSFGYTLLGTVVETEVLRCGLDPLIGFFHQPQNGRPSLMLDLLEEFRPLVDGLVLRLLNRRQLGVLDFERRSDQSLEEILAEMPTAEEAGLAPAAADVDGPSVEAIGGDVPEGLASSAGPPAGATALAGCYLGATGRRIFLKEFFQRLRERLLYPPRQATFELREIVRQQVYHLARVIEGQDAEYLPFIPT
jgi:CRISPR-associated protein Cas1